MARTGRVGVMLHEVDAVELLTWIERAELVGVPAVWLISGSLRPDPLTLLAAAAARTERTRLGTSIVHTFPRHPLAVVQQALVVAALAPGRLRLGVGPSHRATMEGTFGIRFERPLEHLREYVAVLRAALQGGPFDFDGKRFRVRGEVPNPPGVPVLASALGPGAFQLAGEVADGALPFICPLDYLRDQALPALRAGAAQAGRPAPGIYAHCFAAVHRDRGAVHAAAREAIGGMLNAPFYQRMFVQAGFAEAAAGELSERIVDAVVVHGDEAAVAQRLRAHLDAGMEEVVVSPLVVGGDRDAETERVLRLAAAL